MVVVTIDGYELMKGKIVKFFPNRDYGFISYYLNNGAIREIFFHRSSERPIIYDGFDLALGWPEETGSEDPKEGDSVLFAIVKGSKGRPKASPWCFESSYLIAEKELEDDWEGNEEDEWEEDEPRIINVGDGPGGLTICE